MKILGTGIVGFTGMYAGRRLLERGAEVVAIDHLDDYRNPILKRHWPGQLERYSRRRFVHGDIADWPVVERPFAIAASRRVVDGRRVARHRE